MSGFSADAVESHCLHKESVTERKSGSSSDKYAVGLVLLAVQYSLVGVVMD